MDFLKEFSILYENLAEFSWQQGVMLIIGLVLIYLAIAKEMEPSLLLPMGFGTFLSLKLSLDLSRSFMKQVLQTSSSPCFCSSASVP